MPYYYKLNDEKCNFASFFFVLITNVIMNKQILMSIVLAGFCFQAQAQPDGEEHFAPDAERDQTELRGYACR
jgi:bleomycin hydrolase